MSSAFRIAGDALALDIGLLHYRDRAVLRILDRAEAATPRQLAILVYRHRRIAQRRLRRLWLGGLLERAVVSRAQRGGSEYAYRLSDRARRRLGDTATRSRGSNRLGHTLDVVETVCALVTATGDSRPESSVRLWLDEPNAAAVLGTPPFPDSVVVLESDGRSGVICLEIDEATQRRAVIEAKLNGYRQLFHDHPTWWLLFVVPSRARARWFQTAASGVDEAVAARTWTTSLDSLRTWHMDATAEPVTRSSGAASLREFVDSSTRVTTGVEVASEAWLRLLGEGGIEELGQLGL